MAKRIIKLTENQLKEIVQKVINEQTPNKPAPQTNPILNPTQLNNPTGAAPSTLQCIDFQGKQMVNYPNPSFQTGSMGTLSYQGQFLNVYTNGRYVIGKPGGVSDKGKAECSSNSGILELTSDSGGNKIYFTIKGGAGTKPAATKPKMTFKKNDIAPYKFGQSGENIKMMQQSLGVKPTGNFYTATEAAVLKFYPQYKRQTGVDQSTFERIMGGSGTKLQPASMVDVKGNPIKA